jgi:putative FmdB family regulatory protein
MRAGSGSRPVEQGVRNRASGGLPRRQDQGPGWITIWLLYWYPEFISAQGAGPMPTYSYECRKCGHAFRKILSFKEYEEGKVKCPKCGSGNVAQVLETFFAKTSRKS